MEMQDWILKAEWTFSASPLPLQPVDLYKMLFLGDSGHLKIGLSRVFSGRGNEWKWQIQSGSSF